MTRRHFWAGLLVVVAGLSLTSARAAGSITSLKTDYDGTYHSTDGSNEAGQVQFHVTQKMLKNFTGEINYIEAAGAGPGAAGLAELSVEGSVSATGKITMKGTVEGKGQPVQFNLKGTLADDGGLVIASYTFKRGKQVLFRAICSLTED